MSGKPVRLAVSMGDPAGVGPEVILGAMAEFSHDAEIIICGDLGVIKAAAKLMGDAGLDGPDPEKEMDLIPVTVLAESEIKFGKPSRLTGDASYRYAIMALREVLNGDADAMVTAPISKRWWAEAGRLYPGHTELLAEETGAKKFAMMLAAPTLRTVPVTIHEPLASVSETLSVEKIVDAIEQTHSALIDWFGIEKPRLACTGLNPHAGEEGRIGKEEIDIIIPALEKARVANIDIVGPLAADSLFARADKYDAVICMYHDQALIPIKTLHPQDAVNLTLGLPIVRTSPDHGTAFDIAGSGTADHRSMLAAMNMAVGIINKKRRVAYS